jgi:murein DD-endopeptidase MepM/ murein hydrolase activator NlpD
VSSPQLHFEVRKGATALDPMKYMASTTASN